MDTNARTATAPARRARAARAAARRGRRCRGCRHPPRRSSRQTQPSMFQLAMEACASDTLPLRAAASAPSRVIVASMKPPTSRARVARSKTTPCGSTQRHSLQALSSLPADEQRQEVRWRQRELRRRRRRSRRRSRRDGSGSRSRSSRPREPGSVWTAELSYRSMNRAAGPGRTTPGIAPPIRGADEAAAIPSCVAIGGERRVVERPGCPPHVGSPSPTRRRPPLEARGPRALRRGLRRARRHASAGSVIVAQTQP